MSLSVLAQAVLVVFGLFLVGPAMVAFAKPAIAERFFTAFASSAATHYTEQAFRLLIGGSMIVYAPAMWQGGVFRIIGWMIVVTSLANALAPHQRRGYMRAGLGRVIRLAFREYRLHRLEANIQPDNLRSIGLVRSLGFRREGYSPKYLKIGGRWRDHERWAVTAEDWHSTV